MGHEQGGFLSATLSSGTRRAAMLGIGTALAAALVGCSGASMPKQTPGPTTPGTPAPTPSGLTTPEPTASTPTEPTEADIAAAKAAYGEYAAASDAVVYLDSSTWEQLFALLTPERQEIEEAGLKDLADRGFTRHGVAKLLDLELDRDDDPTRTSLWLNACLDLRDITYVDIESQIWIPPNQNEFQATRTQLVRASITEPWRIARVQPDGKDNQCGAG